MFLAAIVALAIAAAPVYASGALPCPAAAAHCHCATGGCDLQTSPTVTCHCPLVAAILPARAPAAKAPLEARWILSRQIRVWGLKIAPPLRPPILL